MLYRSNVCFQVYIEFQDYVTGRCYCVSYRCCGRRLWFSGLCPCMPTGCVSAHPCGTHHQRLWVCTEFTPKIINVDPTGPYAFDLSCIALFTFIFIVWKQHPESQLFLTPSVLSCGWQALVTPAVKPLYLWSLHQWTETELSGMK